MSAEYEMEVVGEVFFCIRGSKLSNNSHPKHKEKCHANLVQSGSKVTATLLYRSVISSCPVRVKYNVLWTISVVQSELNTMSYGQSLLFSQS